jgi:membrane-associated phospholipid phosphatase
MLINSKPGLLALLVIVFLVNMAETSWETAAHTGSPVTLADQRDAFLVQQFERNLVDFEFHDQTPKWAMYAYSVSYFALLPVLGVALLVALARRREIAPMRVLCLAVAVDYLVSLPWFLLFPVPERWAYPESNAMLLSDLWSSRLIDAIRPISALNNSFPSTHVSLTVVVIAVCWLFQVRLRNTVTALGITVILATFLLGIHWLADILAGIAVGILSVAIARRLTDTSEREALALASGHRVTARKIRRVGPLAKSPA